MSDRPLDTLLARPFPSERPEPGRSTLEVQVYWRHDYLDGLESAGRRRISVGGLRNNPLRVELPEGMAPFTLAEIRGDRARIRVPEGAVAGFKHEDGRVEPPVGQAVSRPIPSTLVELGLGQRLAFSLADLTFVLQFVRDHGTKQSLWERIRPKDL
ncbi:MAG TPA: hypothetical protein RMG48_08785 [Myxococcales bacterium LLY-WYZ-16_1]|nr:hypothetical protein [Myxococcales bacterium LLY-WYZ-16_1]